MTDKTKIPKTFRKWFNSHFFDERDTIDIEHEYDAELSTEENREAFKKKFYVHYCEDKKEVGQKIKAQNEQQKSEQTKQEIEQRKTYLQDRFGVPINFVG